jgi:LacI family transcriptional regulator
LKKPDSSEFCGLGRCVYLQSALHFWRQTGNCQFACRPVDKFLLAGYDSGNDAGKHTGIVAKPDGFSRRWGRLQASQAQHMARVKSSVTIQDVAAAAGVSVSTVSRVLNNKVDVAEATSAKIRRVIDELGYVSNLAAKSMRSRQTNVLGLIAPDLAHSFSLLIVKGVSQAIRSLGYDLFVYTGGENRAQSRAAWEQQQVSLLSGSIADGILVVTPYAESFRSDCPLVAIDPHREGADYPGVIATNRAGVLDAMAYLLGLGHRRIGYIGGRPDLQSAQRRWEGYIDSLAQAGIALDHTLVAVGDYKRTTAYASARQLLLLDCPPSAILAANDDMALGVYDAAAELGVRIPDQLSVVGFDNVPEAGLADPPLTSVDQSIEAMGRLAVELLARLIQGERVENRLHKAPTRLVIRSSCRAVMNIDRIV